MAQSQLVMRREVCDAATAIVELARRWHVAHDAWCDATRRRERVVTAADRRVINATGDLGLRRFEMACRRRRISTRADALLVARARRARPAVEHARQRLAEIQLVEDAAVHVARLHLVGVTTEVLCSGSIARDLTGRDERELRQLVRGVGLVREVRAIS